MRILIAQMKLLVLFCIHFQIFFYVYIRVGILSLFVTSQFISNPANTCL